MLKKKLDYQMMIVIIIVMNQISVFLNKSNTRNHNLILRFKSLGKRQVKKMGSSRLSHIFSSSFLIGK